MTYRPSWLKEAGFDAFPTDLDGFLRMAKRLKASGRPMGLSLGPSTVDGNCWTHWLLWTFGGATFDETDRATINSPETLQALEYLRELYPHFVDGTLGWTDDSNNRAFAVGEIACTNNNSAIYAELVAARDPIAADTDHALYPVGPLGHPAELHMMRPMLLFKHSPKPVGKGTGLGLSMIYGFAKQSEGHLSIYSEVGVGTTVRLYLPKARTDAVNDRASPPSRPVLDRGGETILVVDDNPELRKASVRRLAGLGYKCREADNGPAALVLLETALRFDLLFTDIGLPDGISGYELARLAEQRQPWLKVLFTTGYAKAQRRDRDDQHEMTPVLRKPYRAQELAEKVRAILDSTA